jgi:FkbM family methyltransferase
MTPSEDGMNWYFALSVATLASPHHDWPSLIRAAVHSARRSTRLVPHLIWDGPETGFLDELRGLGVTVLFHRVPFYDGLVGFKDDPVYLGTAAGCFLRVEIPVLEQAQDFVLYTDADVLFLRDPVPMLREMRPECFAAMSEFTLDDGLNSGVLLLNVRQMRAEYPAFRAFIEANLALGLDQDMYRHFYAGRWEKLPPGLNWKPYWGRSDDAVILHWHGIKPVLARTLLDDPAARVIPALQMLVERNPEGYRYYLGIYDEYLSGRRERCAVVLVVKDEAADIAAWLAWHLELGFDACIVYDDDSTDGTWEILQAAGRGQDVRTRRTIGPKPGPYEIRQEICYRQALADGRDEFEWLAFFDADEFLALYEDEDVHAFLGRFGNVDAVAVNWCNYGSGGHLLKPAAPAFEAYIWHGDERQTINRHVKSIVRPRQTGPDWRNVHCLDVPDERYRLANGDELVWSETPGIIKGEPDWQVAKLMHYQCRSMEHFVERLKKRPELAAVPGIWQACDVRQVRDERPAKRGDAVRARMAALGAGAPVVAAAEKLVFDIGMSEGNDTALYLAKGFRVVGVEADVKMFVALQDRFEAAIGDGRLTLYDRAASEQAGRILEFFRHDRHQGRSGLTRGLAEFSEGSFSAYHVLTTDWRDLAGRHGVPDYLKLDIDGHEAAFLRGMKGAAALPAFVSIECREFAPVEVLAELGYRWFQLVDQNLAGAFGLPAMESDVGWADFVAFSWRWQAAGADCHRTSFACHARLA